MREDSPTVAVTRPSWLRRPLLALVVWAAAAWALTVWGDRAAEPGARAEPVPAPPVVRAELLNADAGAGAGAAGTLTVDEVRARPEGEWAPLVAPGYVERAGERVVWARLTFFNPGAEPLRGVFADAEFHSDRVEWWWPEAARDAGGEARGGGGGEGGDVVWTRLVAGERPGEGERVWRGRDAAFPVELAAGETRVAYLRVEDHFPARLRPVWWARERAFDDARVRAALWEAAYLGLLFALLAYHLVLWTRLRDADLGRYLVYLGSLGLFLVVARGHDQTLGVALGSPAMETVAAGALALAIWAATRFARSLLELAERAPTAERAARVAEWISLALAAGAASTPWWPDIHWLKLCVLAVLGVEAGLLVVAVAAGRAGARHAGYFIVAFGGLFAGFAPMAWRWVRGEPLGFSPLAGLLGAGLEAVLLAVIMARRIADAQGRALAEAERARTLQEAYADELEAEVKARTAELAAANADKDRMLAVLGHDLRGPLVGLVQLAGLEAARAEPAGLARFAAETAAQGRQLLLLIEDIVLWARLRAGRPGRETCTAEALLAPARALHATRARQGGVELRLIAPPGLRVETDLVMAQTLVRNLVDNAARHARTTVWLEAREEGGEGREDERGRVGLSLRDDGPGLPPEVLARFARGVDGEENAGDAGAGGARGGLGLRLCMELGRALDARLVAGRAAEGGAEFRLSLRRAREKVG